MTDIDTSRPSDLSAINTAIGPLGRPNVINSDPRLLPRYRAKLAQAIAGTSRVRIACVGDSLTTGAGAGTTGTTAVDGARATSYPAQLAKLLRKAGFRVSEDSIWGDSTLPDPGVAAVARYDPKISFGAGWARYMPVIGGFMFRAPEGAGELAYAPAEAFDTLAIYYIQQPGLASIAVHAGDQSTEIKADGPAGLLRSTWQVPRSRDTIRVARSGAGREIYIAGLDCWSSDTEISIYNISAYGTGSKYWNSAGSPWTPRNAMSIVAPDLIILNVGGADIVANVPVGTYKSNMQEMIGAWRATGSDIVLVRNHPFRDSVKADAVAAYAVAQYELAFEHQLPLIDLSRRFESYAKSRDRYRDFIHLTAAGYVDIAMAVYDVVRPQ